MRKIILGCAFISIYLGTFAQTDTVRNNTDHNMDNKHGNNHKKDTGLESQKNGNKNKDCAVMMANGQMMMMMDGKTMIMDKEMTMKNGTIVMMDGTVKMIEGKTLHLKDGECMDMSGKMVMVKNDQIKKE